MRRVEWDIVEREKESRLKNKIDKLTATVKIGKEVKLSNDKERNSLSVMKQRMLSFDVYHHQHLRPVNNLDRSLMLLLFMFVLLLCIDHGSDQSKQGIEEYIDHIKHADRRDLCKDWQHQQMCQDYDCVVGLANKLISVATVSCHSNTITLFAALDVSALFTFHLDQSHTIDLHEHKLLTSAHRSSCAFYLSQHVPRVLSG